MDILTIGKTLIDEGKKLLSAHEEKAEQEKMQAIVEELRLRVYTGGGNSIRRRPMVELLPNRVLNHGDLPSPV